MRTEDLIVSLVREGESVRPLAPPAVRLLRWGAMAIVPVVAGVLLIGLRADALAVVDAWWSLGALALLGGTAGLAGHASLVLAVPGASGPALRSLPLVAAGAWAGLILVLVAGDPDWRAGAAGTAWMICISKVAALAAIPAALLVSMVRRAAPLDTRWAAGLAVLAATAISAAGVQFACPIDLPTHLLLGHVVPVALFSATLGATGGRVLAPRSL